MPQQILGNFDYKDIPLNPKLEEFRILHLFPGDDSDPIRCRLERVSVASRPKYEPISYAWGDPTVQEPIECNGSVIGVTKSLFEALKQIRSTIRGTEPRLLWADAICINQLDGNEKSSQVLLMRKIYESGERTLIWLGLGDDDTYHAFRLMDLLLRAQRDMAASSDERTYLQIQQQKSEEPYYELPMVFNKIWAAYYRFLGRDWFTRVWIIQEVSVSKNPVVICGTWEKSWLDFLQAIGYGVMLTIPVFDSGRRVQRIMEIGAMREKFQQGKLLSLLSLLLISRGFLATDPRDKIYALLGLASDARKDFLDVKPDYAMPVNQVYKQVSAEMLRLSARIDSIRPDILSVPRVGKASEVGFLPSWTPDWTNSSMCMSLKFPNLADNEWLRFEATPPESPFTVTFSGDVTKIRVSALLLDVIQVVGNVHTSRQGETASIFQTILQAPREYAAFNGWERICGARSGRTYSPTGESILDAYWKTLIVGQTGDQETYLRQAFDEWHQRVQSKFAMLPDSKLTQWALPIIGLPATVKYYWDQFSDMRAGYDAGRIMEFRQLLTSAQERSFFKSTTGYIGLGPPLIRRGDHVALIKGHDVPLILRQDSESGHFLVIGDTYIHGVMHGEAYFEEKSRDIWID
jgi:Heterokaryon incompatibility protein (HET)